MITSAAPPTRTVPVALSAEALLHQWARQSAAPAGAAVVADSEIAARKRGGVEWRTPQAVAVSVLARPESLDPDAVDAGWAAVSLAAAQALDDCEEDAERAAKRVCLWPDEVQREPPDGRETAPGFVCTLGPGRVESAALTVRVGPLASAVERRRVTAALLRHLREQAEGLNEPGPLIDAYRERCATLGRSVELRMLPHGTMRGLAEDVDDKGRLVLKSPTGLTERIMVASLNEVRLLP